MTGHEIGLSHIKAELGLQHAGGGHRHSHQGRLGVFGQGQLVFRPFLHQGRQFLIQGVIDFGKDFTCTCKGFRQRRTHTDSLAALTRKEKREAHLRFIRIIVKLAARGRTNPPLRQVAL